MINDDDDNEKNHRPILDDDDDDDDVLTFNDRRRRLEKEREKEKERAERGIFISIRFFLVISHNASLFSLLPSPPDGKRERAYARAYHYREGIIG